MSKIGQRQIAIDPVGLALRELLLAVLQGIADQRFPGLQQRFLVLLRAADFDTFRGQAADEVSEPGHHQQKEKNQEGGAALFVRRQFSSPSCRG